MKPTVLIVDDDTNFATVVSKSLGRSGFRVLTVDDGAAVDDALARTTVDALVLDLQMPGMNGFEVIRRVRHPLDSQAARPKIVVLSGRAEPETASFVTRLGADAFLLKPMGSEDLVRTLRRVLSA